MTRDQSSPPGTTNAPSGLNSTATLKLIGYWKERLGDPFPLPQHLEGEVAPGLRDQICTYLESGVHFEQYRGYSNCRYGCGDNGSSELSDGVWVWPSGLVHYVREHRLELPSEFLAHALHAGQPVDAIRKLERGVDVSSPPEAAKLDDSHWIEWSSARIPRSFKAAILRAQESVEHTLAKALEREATEQQQEREKREPGESTCMSRGCYRSPLPNVVFCATCLATPNQGEGVRVSLENAELHELLRRAYSG